MTCLHGKTLGVRIIVAPTVHHICNLYDFQDMQGTELVRNEDAVPLCDLAGWLWLSWTDTEFLLGRGPSVGPSVLLTWTRTANRIDAISFSGLDEVAAFEFSTLPSKSCCIKWYFLLQTIAKDAAKLTTAPPDLAFNESSSDTTPSYTQVPYLIWLCFILFPCLFDKKLFSM